MNPDYTKTKSMMNPDCTKYESILNPDVIETLLNYTKIALETV